MIIVKTTFQFAKGLTMSVLSFICNEIADDNLVTFHREPNDLFHYFWYILCVIEYYIS